MFTKRYVYLREKMNFDQDIDELIRLKMYALTGTERQQLSTRGHPKMRQIALPITRSTTRGTKSARRTIPTRRIKSALIEA